MCRALRFKGSAAGDSLFVDYSMSAASAVKRSAPSAGLTAASAAKRIHVDACGSSSSGGGSAAVVDVDSEDEFLYASASDVHGDGGKALDELSGGSGGHGSGGRGLRLTLLDVIPVVAPFTDMCMGVAPKTEFEEEEVRLCAARSRMLIA